MHGMNLNCNLNNRDYYTVAHRLCATDMPVACNSICITTWKVIKVQ